ncbi:hypothetical protein [Ruminococcus flavefaciens]|uniref:hypothetical protein n=1 Tax=Ruminococcus flavefaciens TaxID=1265 RepID=UPI003F115C27
MNCIIYPCSNDVIPFIDYINSSKNDLHIVKAVCPVICRSMIADNICCDVDTDFRASLDECDTVIICDYKSIRSMYNDIISKINISLECGKNVICCAELKYDDLKIAKDIADEKKLKFEYRKRWDYHEVKCYEKQESVIIGIGSLFSAVNTDIIFCNIIKKLNECGYKTVGIGTNSNNMLIDCYTLPKQIFTSTKSSDDKVLYLNDFINDVELRKCPDIIVLQFPGGMSNYAEEVLDGYTLDAYTLSQAVSVDYFILSIPVNVLDPDQLPELDTQYKYKYNFPVDAFAISNSAVDASLSFDSGCVEITTVRNDYSSAYKEKCSDLEGYFICELNENDQEALISDFIDKVSSNVEEL